MVRSRKKRRAQTPPPCAAACRRCAGGRPAIAGPGCASGESSSLDVARDDPELVEGSEMRITGGQRRVRRLVPRVTNRDRAILGAAADARQRCAAVSNRCRQPSTRTGADGDQKLVVVRLERGLDRIETLGFEE